MSMTISFSSTPETLEELHKQLLQRSEPLVEIFKSQLTPSQIYEAIIDLGKQAPSLPPEKRLPAHLVAGCQSETFCSCQLIDGIIKIEIYSESLISAGLATLLALTYSDLPPHCLLLFPPPVASTIQLPTLLSPTRAQGLTSILRHLRKQVASQMSQK